MKRFVLLKYFQIDLKATSNMGHLDRLMASLINELPALIGLCLFFGTSYASYFLFRGIEIPAMQLSFLAILICISLIRMIAILSRVFLSPDMDSFRVVMIDSRLAGKVHKLMLVTMSYIITTMMFSVLVQRLGADFQSILLIQLFFTTVLLLVTATGIYIAKDSVKNSIIRRAVEKGKTSWGYIQFASVWHILAILYLVLLEVFLVADSANQGESSKGAFLVSFFVVPVWLIADRISQWVVRNLMSTLKIHQEQYDDQEEITEEILLAREKGKNLYLQINRLARVTTVAVLGVWLASLWNIEIPFISNLAAVVLDALIMITITLIFWQVINTWIENKIQDSMSNIDVNKEEDDEWGSAADMGRSYTLLPIVRKFIAAVLLVMVTLTILSSSGINIGPLLAGAGVIGLAVGFGAQKLVSDIFSGFFYLFDDAFRVGEYIEANSVSGLVESITLRNVMLRHHRGMLQIVPHSEMGAITNYMRGGIVVKFNLNFPYDANIDKIRKIIKKVGQAMLADEEMGKDFIKPVKSQGVREISDSTMTIRVKFTAKPGTHFVIRREAFKRITEALAAQNIHYAHRKVIVDIPASEHDNIMEKLSEEQVEKILKTAGGAAATTINGDKAKSQTTLPQRSQLSGE